MITDQQILVNISIKESVSVFGEHKRRFSKTFKYWPIVCVKMYLQYIYLSIHPSIHPSIYTHTHADVLTVQIIIIICYIYIALFWVLKALYIEGGISSTTTSVQHPPGWCNGSHIAPERPPHTSLLVERRQRDEANRCMGIIRMFSSNIQMQKHPVVLLLETNPSNMYV